ncbi:Oidioi.mRNA.OKI2018_I69.XSR.g15870.t1.cds [Oikopleura dioica]|uniref:non-specific serine/threonine protein kinase n=1 Tax=Oikopleura dioica TaxID=34765 RepID=A0ABN7SI80_OIKDI|nr:Oidioi.mRNA.OKI2018_I69.XSR.g15870.t1.cds [Oikopleura dioica]
MPGNLVRLRDRKNKRPLSSRTPAVPKFPPASQAPGIKSINHIGSGAYGDVFHCRRNPEEDPPRALAAKVIYKLDPAKERPDKVESFNKFLHREIEVTQTLDHRNVIKYVTHFDNEKNVILVVEHAFHGDLLNYLRLHDLSGYNDFPRATNFCAQIVRGITYLHQRDIIHRDLKLENILVGKNERLMISDFGFARVMRPEDRSDTYCGSAAYAPPEILQTKSYSGMSVDIWALGCMIFCILTGSMPFRDSTLRDLMEEQANGAQVGPEIPDNLGIQPILNDIWSFYPGNRPEIEDFHATPWLERYFNPDAMEID